MINGASTAGSTLPTEPQVCCKNIAATATNIFVKWRVPFASSVPTQNAAIVNVDVLAITVEPGYDLTVDAEVPADGTRAKDPSRLEAIVHHLGIASGALPRRQSGAHNEADRLNVVPNNWRLRSVWHAHL